MDDSKGSWCEGKEQEFGFGCVKFEMDIRPPWRDVE